MHAHLLPSTSPSRPKKSRMVMGVPSASSATLASPLGWPSNWLSIIAAQPYRMKEVQPNQARLPAAACAEKGRQATWLEAATDAVQNHCISAKVDTVREVLEREGDLLVHHGVVLHRVWPGKS